MSSAPPAKATTAHRRLLWLAVGVGVLAAGAAAAWVVVGRRPVPSEPDTPAKVDQVDPDDPRITFQTPFRNVRPGVKYVGDDACADCHADIIKQFRQHPMGRSLAPIAVAGGERYDAAARDPFDALGLHYLVRREGEREVHREEFRDAKGRAVAGVGHEITHRMGSGMHGFTYLVVKDGYVFQSPIAWYSQKKIWDVSPGYSVANNPHFERSASADCLFCHANQAEPVRNTINRFEEPVFRGHTIGCERCHGPGELHVAQPGAAPGEPADYNIVNPKHLAADLREAVCQQCHLQGARLERHRRHFFDYRPGLPLEAFVSVFILPPEATDEYKAVGHHEQMHLSACFRATRGTARQMGCTSCHDPHGLPGPAERVAFYEGRCLQCHAEKPYRGHQAAENAKVARAGKAAAGASCIDCHMPSRQTDVAHTTGTEHRIVRWRDRPPHIPKDVFPPFAKGRIELSHFHYRPGDARDPELARDVATMLMWLTVGQGSPSAKVGAAVAPMLQDAVRRSPDDVVAWENLGQALRMQNRQRDALNAFESGLRQAPEQESTLAAAADCAEGLREPDTAVDYWRRAIAVCPLKSEYHARLANLLARRQEWVGAREEAEAALRINPMRKDARMTRALALLRLDEAGAAQAEVDRLAVMFPEETAAFREWLAGQRR